MADIPIDQLTPGTPFSYVGLDVFGPRQLGRAVYLSDDKGHTHRADRVNGCITKIPSLARTCYTAPSRLRTNFVGAYNDLQASLNEMDNNDI